MWEFSDPLSSGLWMFYWQYTDPLSPGLQMFYWQYTDYCLQDSRCFIGSILIHCLQDCRCFIGSILIHCLQDCGYFIGSILIHCLWDCGCFIGSILILSIGFSMFSPFSRKPYRKDQLQVELSTRSDKCSSRKGIAKEKSRSKSNMDNRGNTTKNEGKEKIQRHSHIHQA